MCFKSQTLDMFFGNRKEFSCEDKTDNAKIHFLNILYFFPDNFDADSISEKYDNWFNSVQPGKTNNVKLCCVSAFQCDN